MPAIIDKKHKRKPVGNKKLIPSKKRKDESNG